MTSPKGQVRAQMTKIRRNIIHIDEEKCDGRCLLRQVILGIKRSKK